MTASCVRLFHQYYLIRLGQNIPSFRFEGVSYDSNNKMAELQTLLLHEIPIGTLCLVQAVRQQYSSIGVACSADMAPHKLRMTNRVESICRMV